MTTNYQASATGYNVIQEVGVSGIPGTTTVTVTDIGAAGNVDRSFGTTVPSDGEAGYATGSYFHTSTGVPGATVFFNEGSSTSCSFRAPATGAVARSASTAAINATATATAAQVATGYITSTSAAGTTITLPTGTLLGTALGATQGTTLDLYIDNTAGASTVTIAVAVNGILSAAAVAGSTAGAGLLTVPSGVTGQACFRLMFSSATAYTFSRIA